MNEELEYKIHLISDWKASYFQCCQWDTEGEIINIVIEKEAFCE